MKLLDIDDLWVRFPTSTGLFEAVRGVSFSLGRERLGVVGESGSGKSMTGRAILRLIRPPGEVQARHIALEGVNLLDLPKKAMRAVRGQRISMVMQDPKFSLNPVMTIGDQMIEAFRFDRCVGRSRARQKSLDMLNAVSIRDPERVLRAEPHEMSGGMVQRIMIAMMLIPNPDIRIADEPTSALDVSVRGQVLSVIDRLVEERGMGLIFISHDLNLVAHFCDRMLIMYAGRVVETCPVDELHAAQHPYTHHLLESALRFVRNG
ncbi:MAG: ABC transporter ATP-binding protein [Pseudomonadota bacterium]